MVDIFDRDADQARADEEFDEKEHTQLLNDYKTLYGTGGGKRVIQDLLYRAHIFETTFVPKDSHRTAFREGERELGLYILQMLEQLTLVSLERIQEKRIKQIYDQQIEEGGG